MIMITSENKTNDNNKNIDENMIKKRTRKEK